MNNKFPLILLLSSILISACTSKQGKTKKEITFEQWHEKAMKCDDFKYSYAIVDYTGYSIRNGVKKSEDGPGQYPYGNTSYPFVAKTIEKDYFANPYENSDAECVEYYCHFYSDFSVDIYYAIKTHRDDEINPYIAGYCDSGYRGLRFNKKGILTVSDDTGKGYVYTKDGSIVDQWETVLHGKISYFD